MDKFAEEIKLINTERLSRLERKLWLFSHDINLFMNISNNYKTPVDSLSGISELAEEFWKVVFRELRAREGVISSKYK